jgi:hypothetical protein
MLWLLYAEGGGGGGGVKKAASRQQQQGSSNSDLGGVGECISSAGSC